MTTFGEIISKIEKLFTWITFLDIGVGTVLNLFADRYILNILTVISILIFIKGLFSLFCAVTDKGKSSCIIYVYLVIGGLFLFVAQGIVIYSGKVEYQTVLKVLDKLHERPSTLEALYFSRFFIAVFLVVCPVYFTSMWIVHYCLYMLYRKLVLMERYNY